MPSPNKKYHVRIHQIAEERRVGDVIVDAADHATARSKALDLYDRGYVRMEFMEEIRDPELSEVEVKQVLQYRTALVRAKEVEEEPNVG